MGQTLAATSRTEHFALLLCANCTTTPWPRGTADTTTTGNSTVRARGRATGAHLAPGLGATAGIVARRRSDLIHYTIARALVDIVDDPPREDRENRPEILSD